MKKLIIALILFISGCVGDRLDFRHEGSVYKKGNDSVCVTSKEGDNITYYLLSSSENNYSPPLLFEDNIERKYPNHCFDVKLKKGVTYNLIYEMNDIKYRVDFKLDDKSNIKQGVNL
ncbi:putative T6SS immunity periplasmic lipoprotein [Rouxiella sp. Mn2063]|uniref:putative T6SS immunity periplasmic lipoprotein n=1 Tax=Rouxiella sp. Mn2063 TaxID=3395262 RepID=UPI003BCB3D15